MLCPRAELRFAFGFFDFCFAGHSKTSSMVLAAASGFGPQREAQLFEEDPCFVVIARRGDDRDIHALNVVNLVRLNFWKHELFVEAHAVIAATVERLGIESAKVAHARQS